MIKVEPGYLVTLHDPDGHFIIGESTEIIDSNMQLVNTISCTCPSPAIDGTDVITNQHTIVKICKINRFYSHENYSHFLKILHSNDVEGIKYVLDALTQLNTDKNE